MSTHEIAKKLEDIVSTGDRENFIYDFLIAYGIPKSTVTLLKKGNLNRSKRDNEVFYAKKILFRVESGDNLLNAIDSISREIISSDSNSKGSSVNKDSSVNKKNRPRFVLMTDYERLVAKDLSQKAPPPPLDMRFVSYQNIMIFSCRLRVEKSISQQMIMKRT